MIPFNEGNCYHISVITDCAVTHTLSAGHAITITKNRPFLLYKFISIAENAEQIRAGGYVAGLVAGSSLCHPGLAFLPHTGGWQLHVHRMV